MSLGYQEEKCFQKQGFKFQISIPEREKDKGRNKLVLERWKMGDHNMRGLYTHCQLILILHIN